MEKKQMENPENESFNVTDLSIEQLIPNTFENCIVTVFEGHHTLDMPITMTGMVFNNWLKTKAGIFSKDVHRFTNNKPHGKYVLYEGLANKFIARIINEDELLMFETLKLVDGHLKDVPYMILKHIKDDESFTCVKRYIEVPDELQEDVVTHNIEEEEEDVIPYNSISLFSE